MIFLVEPRREEILLNGFQEYLLDRPVGQPAEIGCHQEFYPVVGLQLNEPEAIQFCQHLYQLVLRKDIELEDVVETPAVQYAYGDHQ